MNFFNFFYVFQNIVFEKKIETNRAAVSSIARKILACDMESWYEKISKIRNVTFIFQNFPKNFQRRGNFFF